MAIQKVKLRLEKEDCTGPRKLDEKQIRHEQKKTEFRCKTTLWEIRRNCTFKVCEICLLTTINFRSSSFKHESVFQVSHLYQFY